LKKNQRKDTRSHPNVQLHHSRIKEQAQKKYIVARQRQHWKSRIHLWNLQHARNPLKMQHPRREVFQNLLSISNKNQINKSVLLLRDQRHQLRLETNTFSLIKLLLLAPQRRNYRSLQLSPNRYKSKHNCLTQFKLLVQINQSAEVQDSNRYPLSYIRNLEQSSKDTKLGESWIVINPLAS